MIIKIIYIAIGGSLGSILRFLFSNFCKLYFPFFPIGTLLINVLGSFFIGLLISFLNNKEVSEIFIRYFLIIGLLGSFTTFSAFSFETIQLIYDKKVFLSLVYIFLSIFLCIVGAFFGFNINKI